MPTNIARIVVREPSGAEREVEISKPAFTLGRQSDSVLEDTGSRHGTFVNGQRISSQLLKSGDQIGLGVSDAYRLIFATEAAILPELLQKFGKAPEGPAPELHHLGLLLQMAQLLHRAAALDEVLSTLVESAIQLAGAELGLLFLCEQDGQLRLHLARGRSGMYLPVDKVSYSESVVERVARFRHEEVVVEDESTGRPSQETGIITDRARGVVALPLQKLPMLETSGETMRQVVPQLLGVLYLETRLRAASVTGLDRQVLQTLALEGATVIENARLFRMARQQELSRHDLELARSIQQGLLPRQLPQTDYFQLQAMTMPCRTVGGDYYDVTPLPCGRYGITVADVSGKGLPAAMMAVTLQGAFTASAAGDPPLEDLFRRVNEFLCDRTPLDMYATLFYGVVDREGRVEFVNAGHLPPLVLRQDSELEVLKDANFPIGMFPGSSFAVSHAQLAPGDLMLLVSDGVTEAQNDAQQFFGDERLHAILAASTGRAAVDICDNIVQALHNFVGDAPQADDLTVIALHFGRTLEEN
jgi:phosphoserine phosphatase RsbU/P